jgi:hypothetical protein
MSKRSKTGVPRRTSQQVTAAIGAGPSVSQETRTGDRTLRDEIEKLIHVFNTLNRPAGRAPVSFTETQFTLERDSRQLFESFSAPQIAGSLDAKILGVKTACTPLNRNNLPLVERAPEISTQLIVLEHLFQAAREKGSGAIPMHGDPDWDSFWLGLERIVRHVRLLAEDMYAQGQLEGC